MSLKKTLLLALVLLAICLYIFKVELPNEEAKKNEALLLNGIPKETLSRLEIANESGSFVLKNDAPKAPDAKPADKSKLADPEFYTHWSLQDLPGSPLDPGTLSSLFSYLADFRLEDPIPSKEVDPKLTIYELDKPKVSLKLEALGKSLLLKFGKSNDFVGKRYTMLEGKPDVYLTQDTLFSVLSKTKSDFRNRTPINFLDSDLSTIELKQKELSEVLKITSQEAAKWQIAQPIKAQASYAAISGYTTNVRNLRADDFIDNASDKLAQYKLDNPEVQLTFSFKESLKKDALVLVASSYKEKKDKDSPQESGTYFAVKGSPTIYKTKSDIISGLKKSVDEMRERKLFQFATDEVVQADFEQADSEALSLVRSNDKWQVNGKEGDVVFVRELLNNLSQLEASGFPNENQDFGFNTPRLKVALRLSSTAKDSKEKKTINRLLVVGAQPRSNADKSVRYYAAVDDLSQPFIISDETFKTISRKEETLLKSNSAAAPLLTPNLPAPMASPEKKG